MVRRLAEAVAAFFLQWLPTEAAYFANFPGDGGSGASVEEPGPDGAQPQGKRRRVRPRRSGQAGGSRSSTPE